MERKVNPEWDAKRSVNALPMERKVNPEWDAKREEEIAMRLSKYKRSFSELSVEQVQSPHYRPLDDRVASVTLLDLLYYWLENAISADAVVPFYILIVASFSALVLLSWAWFRGTNPEENEELEQSATLGGAMFMVFQVLITGGFDISIVEAEQRLLFMLMIFTGVIFVSVLIGLITDSVGSYLRSLSEGASRVVEKNHTLILGWNESTARAVCQLSYLRRVYRIQNERWDRVLFPWRRVKPSSPVSCAPIIILHDGNKEYVEGVLRARFAEHGIFRTKVGRDIIFRRGDPCSAHDLSQVAAHQASAILLMMTEKDKAEAEESRQGNWAESEMIAKPSVENAATIRCLLALRNLIYSNCSKSGGSAEIGARFNPDLRVVVQLHMPCQFMNAASFLSPEGRHVVYLQDLTLELNSIMFTCASRPGLSRILMALLDFEKCAIRCRIASEVCGGPENAKGFFIGKTTRYAMLHTHWNDGCVLIGTADQYYNYYNQSFETKEADRDDEKIKKVDVADDEEDDGHNDDDASYASSFSSDSQGDELYDIFDDSLKGDGIMNDPKRVIQPTDYLIFLGTTSNPKASLSKDDVEYLNYEAKRLLRGRHGNSPTMRTPYSATRDGINNTDYSELYTEPAKPLETMAASNLRRNDFVRTRPKNILLLGFRPEWSNNTLRFMSRIEDISDSLELGSTLTCVNAMSKTSFAAFLTGPCGFSGDHKSGFVLSESSDFENINKLTIWHHEADPIHYDLVKPVFEISSRPPHVAICLGSVVGKDLKAGSRDSRILSMLLILRDLAQRYCLDMHIVAENQQDQTSTLAMTPKPGKKGLNADFINTPAIIARSLCLNLAYPQIHEKVVELLVKRGGAEVQLMSPPELLGRQTYETFSFGVMQRIINLTLHGMGMAVGYTKGPELRLGVIATERIHWSPQHRVICIVRRRARKKYAHHPQELEEEERSHHGSDNTLQPAVKSKVSMQLPLQNRNKQEDISGIILPPRKVLDEKKVRAQELLEQQQVQQQRSKIESDESNKKEPQSKGTSMEGEDINHQGPQEDTLREEATTKDLPPGWVEEFSSVYGKPFYFHTKTTHTTWVRPVLMKDGTIVFPRNGESRVTGISSSLNEHKAALSKHITKVPSTSETPKKNP